MELTPEIDRQLDELNELSKNAAGALQSAWEPRCIARAFASPLAGSLALTMQGWIDLEAVRSPLLAGRDPETTADLAVAFAAFGLDYEDTPPEEAVLIVGAMKRAIGEAFAAPLPMRQPEAQPPREDGGFGSFAPVLACLVFQAGMAPRIALNLDVAQAFILIATHRYNQGWEVAGEPYAVRDLEPQPEEARG